MATTGYQLNVPQAVALGAILRAAQGCKHVRWLNEDTSKIMEGTVRHVVRDLETAAFLGENDDVRDGFLRITSGFEYFLPVRVCMEMVEQAIMVFDD